MNDWWRSARDDARVRGVVVALVSLGVGSAFAARQEIWMDETTQLSGISLGPVEVVRWLAGANRDRFAGIPGDRMPPISYWVQWLWSRVFGLTEHSMRMLSVVLVALAAVVVAGAAARAWGGAAGWVAGLTFALSPNVVYTGAEIRAYPFLLLFSACAVAFFLRLLEEEGRGKTASWAGLVLSCLAATYSHYFGLVLTGATFAALGWVALRRKTMWRPLIASGLAIAVGAAGLLPFVRSAAGMGAGTRGLGPIGRAAVRLAYRCIGGHASWATYLPITVLGLAGVVGALAVGLLRPERPARAARLLALAAGVGLGAALVGRLATHTFESLQATYNLWVVPAVILIGASAVAAEAPRLRLAGRVAAGLLLTANLAATIVLIRHADAFAHSAGDRINAEVAQLGGPDDVIVVHESEGPVWQFAFCPLRYVYGGAIHQYLAEWGADGSLKVRREPEADVTEDPSQLHGKHLAIIHVEDVGTDGVVRYLHTGEAPTLSDDRLVNAFIAQGWVRERRETLMALGAEQVDWLTPPSR